MAPATVWRAHRKPQKVSDSFVSILNGILYFPLASKTKNIFEIDDLNQQ